ncbi:hypothetical protein [Pseudotenacibaculum haliotis]|uniref:Uncharacterized protein n=1 Tax=Pseudotenacibaculum haliotis TaxID=1862138 RepID=A0ABW5LVN1_9FLAO
MDKIKNKSILPITIQEVEFYKKNPLLKKVNASVKVKNYQSSSDYFEGFHRPISKIITFDE